ncbi:MAG: hypothetical protein RIS36_475 [Pseudomonadota bacterium]|jgi:hypothetical protein
MKRLLSPTVLLAGSVLTSVMGAFVTVLLGGQEAVRSTVQLAVFPILLLFLGGLTIKGVGIPRVLVGLSAIGVLCGAIVRYSDVGLQDGAYGVARFEGDALESKTRIFRDNVRRFVSGNGSPQVGVIGAHVAREEHARAVLRERPQLAGVLWGDEKWVNISSRPSSPLSLREMPATSYARQRLQELGITDLWLIDKAPIVGLSKGLDAATFEFVGRFIHAASISGPLMHGASVSPEFEHILQRASSMRAGWSASDHLAAPKLMLGTYYLVRALSGRELEWGDLRCAEATLRSARLIVNKGRNPTLKAAVYSNEAVVRILMASRSAKSAKMMKEARLRLKQAYLTKRDSQLSNLEPRYWDPIVANMTALGMEMPKLTKSRRR